VYTNNSFHIPFAEIKSRIAGVHCNDTGTTYSCKFHYTETDWTCSDHQCIFIVTDHGSSYCMRTDRQRLRQRQLIETQILSRDKGRHRHRNIFCHSSVHVYTEDFHVHTTIGKTISACDTLSTIEV